MKYLSSVVSYLFVELVAGPQSILDGILMVRSMEVEKVDTIGLQPLQGGFQLCTDTLRLQCLPIPGIGLGSYTHCYMNPQRSADANEVVVSLHFYIKLSW